MSDDMKRITITMRAEGYGEQSTEWLVPEELLRPYAIAYSTWLAKGSAKISKAIYEAIIEGSDVSELGIAPGMLNAVE